MDRPVTVLGKVLAAVLMVLAGPVILVTAALTVAALAAQRLVHPVLLAARLLWSRPAEPSAPSRVTMDPVTAERVWGRPLRDPRAGMETGNPTPPSSKPNVISFPKS